MLVIGLGKSGLASVGCCARAARAVYATDEKPRATSCAMRSRPSNRSARASWRPTELARSLGNARLRAVLSPGVPLNSPVVRARASAPTCRCSARSRWLIRLCKAPIVAVTGTKGKSTTTALIGHLLRACGLTVRVGGNIGNPLIDEVLGARPSDWVVAEVSSFQLETIRAFKPRVAVLLNIAPDHLDRYHSMDEYAEAKYRIFANQVVRATGSSEISTTRAWRAGRGGTDDTRIRGAAALVYAGDRARARDDVRARRRADLRADRPAIRARSR